MTEQAAVVAAVAAASSPITQLLWLRLMLLLVVVYSAQHVHSPSSTSACLTQVGRLLLVEQAVAVSQSASWQQLVALASSIPVAELVVGRLVSLAPPEELVLGSVHCFAAVILPVAGAWPALWWPVSTLMAVQRRPLPETYPSGTTSSGEGISLAQAGRSSTSASSALQDRGNYHLR